MFLNIKYKELYFPYNFYFNIHNIEFLFGIFVSFIIKDKSIYVLKRYAGYLLFGGFIIFIVNGINQNYCFLKLPSIIVTLVYGITSSIMIFGLVVLSKFANFNNSLLFRIFALLGSASYSIYLIHVPILSVLNRIVLRAQIETYLHPNFIFLLLVLLSITIGIYVYIFIEKPIILFLKNKFIKSKD